MSMMIRSAAADLNGRQELFDEVVKYLNSSGYSPLLRDAQRGYIAAIAGQMAEHVDVRTGIDEYRIGQRLLASSRYRTSSDIPALMGEVFWLEEQHAILYLLLVTVPTRPSADRSTSRERPSLALQAGYIGDRDSAASLDQFKDAVSSALRASDSPITWTESEGTQLRLQSLTSSGAGHIPASQITVSELECAELLREPILRQLAIRLRQSGGILAHDLTAHMANLEVLLQHGLVSSETVVMCKHDGHQIVRLTQRETIDGLTTLGVKCSCGAPLAQEQIEEYYTANEMLRKLLDNSYWMNAVLVSALEETGVSRDNLILCVHEGPGEVDAFAEVCGALMMFEMKDNHFSMGHAYAFGGRIGVYKPNYAVIISTSGVDADVKQHFERVRPDAEMVYVSDLAELQLKIEEMVDMVRRLECMRILSAVDLVSQVRSPVSEMLALRLGIAVPAVHREVSVYYP